MDEEGKGGSEGSDMMLLPHVQRSREGRPTHHGFAADDSSAADRLDRRGTIIFVVVLVLLGDGHLDLGRAPGSWSIVLDGRIDATWDVLRVPPCTAGGLAGCAGDLEWILGEHTKVAVGGR